MQANNRGNLREMLRINQEKPLFTKTMYGNAFMNRKGSDVVGALDAEGRNPDGLRRVAPLGEIEMLKETPSRFVG